MLIFILLLAAIFIGGGWSWLAFFIFRSLRLKKIFKQWKAYNLEQYITGLKIEYEKGDIRGKYKNNIIRFKPYSKGGKPHIKLRLIPPFTFLPYGLSLNAKKSLSMLIEQMGNSNFKTGDKDFDKKIFIDGFDEKGVVGLLNQRIRGIIITLYQKTVSFRLGPYYFFCDIRLSPEQEKENSLLIKQVLALLNDLLMALIKPQDNKQNIIQNTLYDKNLDVRRYNLNKLVENFIIDKEVRHTLRKALNDPSLETKLIACQYLGDEGIPYIERIIKYGPPAHKIKALDILSSLCRDKGCDILLKHYNDDLFPDIKIAFFDAFARIGDKKANNILLKHLKVKDTQLKIAAIAALGKCGGGESIKYLYNISKNVAFSSRLRIAASTALNEIQSRLGNEGEGWLTVTAVKAKEGTLGMAERGKAGRLSKADEEKV